jgi:hypothetical protein
MPKAFIKGGTYDINKKEIDQTSKGMLYIPANIQIEKETTEEKQRYSNFGFTSEVP